MIPSIITAVALYSGYAIGISGTILGWPARDPGIAFVVIARVSRTAEMDWRIENAARSLGPRRSRLSSWSRFRRYVLDRQVRPPSTSFDDVVIALFMSGIDAPRCRCRWNGIRFEISPAVAAVSSILLVLRASSSPSISLREE
jgi:putative spermidine/putrescine transport system permease protein